MKLARILSAITVALAWAVPGAAEDAPQVPATTRQIQMVKGSDGKYTWRMTRAPVPAVGDHQVLIHVRAVSIQRGDIELTEMMSDVFGNSVDRTGQVGGSDAAGDVVQVGRLVRSVRPGQKVVSLFFVDYVDSPLTADKLQNSHGWTTNGVFGDYVVLEETGIAPMPEWMSYEESATLPSSALTAWAATGAHGYVRKGDTVLVEGTGGVSTFTLQFATALGAHVIITSSSDDKLTRAQALGAKEGINYRKVPDWSARVLELTGGRGADVVMDIGGRSTIEQSTKSVAYEGTLALIGGLGGYDASVSSYALISRGITARGVIAGSRADFMRMCKFMEQHRIRPVIERTYPFDDFEQAMSDLKAGNFVGKLVLRL